MKEYQNIPQVIPASVSVDSTSYIFYKQYKSVEYNLGYESVWQLKEQKQTVEKKEAETDRTSYVYYKVYKKTKFGTHDVATGTEKTTDYFQEYKQKKDTINSNILFSVFLLGTIIIIISKYYYKNHIKNIFFSLINYRTSVAFYRENIKNPRKISVLLSINYLLVSSSFITIWFNNFKIVPVLNTILFIAAVLIILLIYSAIHRSISLIIGHIFKTIQISKEYTFNLKLLNHSVGIILLPALLGIAYSEYPDFFIYTGILAVVILVFLTILRIFKINFANNVQIMYLFLYLCTLEIIPVLLIFKIIKLLSYNSL